jgi:hypothetical protein
MEITFSQIEFWSIDRASIVFNAKVHGKTIQCIVPQEFLTAPFAEPLTEKEARERFRSRRSEIETILRDRISAGDYDSIGEIVVT